MLYLPQEQWLKYKISSVRCLHGGYFVKNCPNVEKSRKIGEQMIEFFA